MDSWKLIKQGKKEKYPFWIREYVIRAIRAFFVERNFREVITPILAYNLPLEPTLYSFRTQWNTSDGGKVLYLNTSPESSLKKLIAAGIGNCFSISHSFRNLESSSRTHNPEFLMLEWYRIDSDYKDIINDTLDLIRYISEYLQNNNNLWKKYNKKICKNTIPDGSNSFNMEKKYREVTLKHLFKKVLNVDLDFLIQGNNLREYCEKKGYVTRNYNWEAWFNQLFLNEIEPYIVKNRFITVKDYPAKISPLCKISKNPNYAERFELYIKGMEIGNGCSEPLDYKRICSMFEMEEKYRTENKASTHAIDYSLLDAIKNTSVKKYAGIGVGVDRLAMIFADVTDIKDILFFPL